MFEKLPESGGRIPALKLTGKLTESNYTDFFLQEVTGTIASQGSVRLFVLVEKYEGWELRSPLSAFRRGVEHGGEVERIAIVGHTRRHWLLTRLMAPFTRGEVRYFPRSRLNDAWEWVREGL